MKNRTAVAVVCLTLATSGCTGSLWGGGAQPTEPGAETSSSESAKADDQELGVWKNLGIVAVLVVVGMAAAFAAAGASADAPS